MKIGQIKSPFYFIAILSIAFGHSYGSDINCFMLESLNPNFLDTWELYYDAKAYITNQALLSNSKSQRSLPILPAEPDAHGFVYNSTPISIENGTIDITFELFDRKNFNKDVKYPDLSQKELPSQGFGLWLDTAHYEDSHTDSGIFIIVNINESDNILSLYLKQFQTHEITEQLIVGQYFLDKLFLNKKLKLNITINNRSIGVNIRGLGTTLYKTLSIEHHWPESEKIFYMGIHAENGEMSKYPICNSIFVTDLKVEGARCELFKQVENLPNKSLDLATANKGKKKIINRELLELSKKFGVNSNESFDHLKQLFSEFEDGLRHEYKENFIHYVLDLNKKLDYLVSLTRLINANSIDNDILQIESVVTEGMEHMKNTFNVHHKNQSEKLIQIHEQLDKRNDKIIRETVQQLENVKKGSTEPVISKITLLALVLLISVVLTILSAIYFKIWKMEKRHIL